MKGQEAIDTHNRVLIHWGCAYEAYEDRRNDDGYDDDPRGGGVLPAYLNFLAIQTKTLRQAEGFCSLCTPT
jgi:hypothetical protein